MFFSPHGLVSKADISSVSPSSEQKKSLIRYELFSPAQFGVKLTFRALALHLSIRNRL